ncbi:hypothetical protein ACIBCO_37795 [Streptomyces violascens]|uniref:hypothetical protein n=1 Tax=Streptomyces violascens TaxID=67381 RepID=UPI0037B229CD
MTGGNDARTSSSTAEHPQMSVEDFEELARQAPKTATLDFINGKPTAVAGAGRLSCLLQLEEAGRDPLDLMDVGQRAPLLVRRGFERPGHETGQSRSLLQATARGPQNTKTHHEPVLRGFAARQ